MGSWSLGTGEVIAEGRLLDGCTLPSPAPSIAGLQGVALWTHPVPCSSQLGWDRSCCLSYCLPPTGCGPLTASPRPKTVAGASLHPESASPRGASQPSTLSGPGPGPLPQAARVMNESLLYTKTLRKSFLCTVLPCAYNLPERYHDHSQFSEAQRS